jgi:hypothetical protein
MEYKRYRDGVIHVRLLKPTADVAPTTIKRGSTDEVLVSKEALERLFAGLNALSDEMYALHNILAFKLTRETGPPDYKDVFDTTPREALSQLGAFVAQLRAAQRRRLALPPIPAFPSQKKA